MEQRAVELLVLVEVRDRLLHVELDLVSEEKDESQEGHHEVEGPVLLLRCDTHVLPDVFRWLLGSLDTHLLTKDLKLSSLNDFLSHLDVPVILKSYKHSRDICIVLLVSVLLNEVL